MSATPLPDLILYGRPGCHLCEEARSFVVALMAERAERGQRIARLVERDIETDPVWLRTFLTTIPVVELGDRRLELVTSVAKVRRLLADVLDGEVTPPSPWAR